MRQGLSIQYETQTMCFGVADETQRERERLGDDKEKTRHTVWDPSCTPWFSGAYSLGPKRHGLVLLKERERESVCVCEV